jgi:hypothetical protein
VFGLYRLNQQRFPTFGISFYDGFTQDSGLFGVRFRQVSLYFILRINQQIFRGWGGWRRSKRKGVVIFKR